MKYFLIIIALIFLDSVLAQSPEHSAFVPHIDNPILKAMGEISTSPPELFVGQNYALSVLTNHDDYDIKITSENLKVTFDEVSRRHTGGFDFEIIPIDTGKCSISIFVVNEQGKHFSLLGMTYHASAYTMPLLYISDNRSGGIIRELDEGVQLICKYGGDSGIFESYPILSWEAQIGVRKFSGTGAILSGELIAAINQSSDEVLILNTVLDRNPTGYSNSEAVFLLK